MTFSLDTSFVLRLLVGEPPAQAAVARRRLEEALAAGETVLATDLVVADAYYALHYHYGVPKDEVRALLRAMLTSGAVRLEPEGSLWALDPARGAGLVDRLIVARHRALGASTWTFDRKLARLGAARSSGSP